MTDCIFCRIIRGEIPSQRVFENEVFVAFRDIHPAAPVHVLLVPKRHVPDLLSLRDDPEGAALMGALADVVPEVARLCGVDRTGFRLVANCGEDGGQTILHLHFHLLGGRAFGERLL